MSNDRLKFRAWDGTSMRYDVTGFEHGRKNEMAGIFLDGDYFAIVDSLSECDKHNPGAVVMQWTGLYDSRGNMVFEGDIVQDADGILGDVRFDEALLCWITPEEALADCLWGSLEVIGNIHESPDLMERPNG